MIAIKVTLIVITLTGLQLFIYSLLTLFIVFFFTAIFTYPLNLVTNCFLS